MLYFLSVRLNDDIPLLIYPMPEINVNPTAKLQTIFNNLRGKKEFNITMRIVSICENVVSFPHNEGAMGISIFKK